jgi:hypothetical protein
MSGLQKNLELWGDGGALMTNDDELAKDEDDLLITVKKKNTIT